MGSGASRGPGPLSAVRPGAWCCPSLSLAVAADGSLGVPATASLIPALCGRREGKGAPPARLPSPGMAPPRWVTPCAPFQKIKAVYDTNPTKFRTLQNILEVEKEMYGAEWPKVGATLALMWLKR